MDKKPSEREGVVMSFCTAINCMDGRTQLPVNTYLRERLGADYVDTVTEPGPVRILAHEPDSALTKSILSRVDISINEHGSQCIAVVAHTDCAGNPASEGQQKTQLDAAVRFLTGRYPTVCVLGLWVNERWAVSKVVSTDPLMPCRGRFSHSGESA